MSTDEAKQAEVSVGGSRILRHERPVAASAEVAHADLATLERHMANAIGPAAFVLHELVSSNIHVDVHVIAPTEEEPTWTLYTTGMSARAMTTPADWTGPQRAELVMRLPATWDLSDAADHKANWPIQWLKVLARLPHDYQTWLGALHTVPNGDPPAPMAPASEMCGVMLVPPLCVEEDADVIATAQGPVMLLGVMPLTAAEMRYKLEHGAEALLAKFTEAGVDDVWDIGRASVV